MSPIFSLIEKELIVPFSDEWKNEELINKLLELKNGDYDSRMSSLYALICAKSKRYEIERFINLWISFNGMYSYFSSLCNERAQEIQQLGIFLKQLKQGNSKLNRKQSNKIGKEITEFLKDYNLSIIDNEWLDTPAGIEFSEQLKDKIENIISNMLSENSDNNLDYLRDYDNSTYGYLLVEYAYYYRCKYIHANEVIPLFSYANEHEINCISLINRLLEDYISNNLHNWFIDDFIKTNLVPRATEIAQDL